MHRLVGDHTDRSPVDAGERGDDRLPLLLGHIEDVAVIEDPQQDLVHVIGHVVAVRNDRIEFVVVRGDLRLQARVDDRRVLKCVGGQKAQVIAGIGERRRLVLDHLVDVAETGLRVSATELVEADILTRDVLDDIGTGDEHVALVAHRHHQVGLDRRIHSSASAFAEDDGDLRDQAAQQLVAATQFGVPSQGGHRILDPGPCRVVDSDDRAADHRHPLHQAGNLAAEHLADRALEHRLVVAEDTDRPAVDGAVAGDHAVAEQRVGIARRFAQRTNLKEAAGVDERIDACAGAGDALLLPLGDGLLTAGLLGQLELLAEFGQLFSRSSRVVGGRHSCGHLACFSSASMRSIASLMWAPTFAMYGSSIAWMCSPPMGTTSSSETNSPQPPSGLRMA